LYSWAKHAYSGFLGFSPQNWATSRTWSFILSILSILSTNPLVAQDRELKAAGKGSNPSWRDIRARCVISTAIIFRKIRPTYAKVKRGLTGTRPRQIFQGFSSSGDALAGPGTVAGAVDVLPYIFRLPEPAGALVNLPGRPPVGSVGPPRACILPLIIGNDTL
jgi:hypothetical protein